jgi:hypothetical protein
MKSPFNHYEITMKSSMGSPVVQLERLQGLQKSIRLALLRQTALPRSELPRLREFRGLGIYGW